MASIKKNFLFTASYQLVNVLMVLVTAPYVSRVLGAQMLGTYTYTFTLAGYFVMFAGLGFALHGKRNIAAIQDDRSAVSKVFTEVYLFQLIVATCVTAVYLVYIAFIAEESYRLLLFTQLFYVISAVVDISWLFFGMEKFQTTSIRNFIIKILTVAAIFIFVKKPDDVTVYALIMAVGALLSQLVLWLGVPKIIKFKREYCKIKFGHLWRSLILFIPVVAISLYTSMDKLMLGRMANMKELAFYENAYKVITIPISLIAAFETVVLPRMVNLRAKEDTGKVNKMVESSFSLVMIVGAPMVCGLIAVAKPLTSVMFGAEFVKTGYIMMILAVIILLAALAGVIRQEILVPQYMDKAYTLSVFVGAFANLALNLFLIPKLGALGAAIATVAAEGSVFLYQMIVTRKMQPYHKYLKRDFPFLLAAVVMGIIVYIISEILPNKIWCLMFLILIGILIYAGLFFIIFKFSGRSIKENLLAKDKEMSGEKDF